MNKIFKQLLSITAALCLCACGNSAQPEEEAAPAEVSETPAAEAPAETAEPEAAPNASRLLYLGQASLRITTPEGRVIYIDPYAPGDYSAPADLILVTHDHYDHNNVDMVSERNEDCQIITQNEALKDGTHQTFDLVYATVEAVEAGNNPNHSITECVGYVITLSDGCRIYISGDTSTTEQMAKMADMNIDFAFLCCDGQYNMGIEEAAECAKRINAGVVVPYHTIVQEGVYFSREQADAFPADNKIILEPGDELELHKGQYKLILKD